mgnify:CR=1 FL=1
MFTWVSKTWTSLYRWRLPRPPNTISWDPITAIEAPSRVNGILPSIGGCKKLKCEASEEFMFPLVDYVNTKISLSYRNNEMISDFIWWIFVYSKKELVTRCYNDVCFIAEALNNLSLDRLTVTAPKYLQHVPIHDQEVSKAREASSVGDDSIYFITRVGALLPNLFWPLSNDYLYDLRILLLA